MIRFSAEVSSCGKVFSVYRCPLTLASRSFPGDFAFVACVLFPKCAVFMAISREFRRTISLGVSGDRHARTIR